MHSSISKELNMFQMKKFRLNNTHNKRKFNSVVRK